MKIPHTGVYLARLSREVLLAVHPPPLPREVCKRLAAGVEELEISKTTPAAEVCIERFGIALSVEVA